MSVVYEVECDGCGQRHGASAEQARKQRVVRCECGQFVRLDRALNEARSEPAPAAVEAPADEVDDEATHMVSSLSAVAALGGSVARAPQATLHDEEHGSRPAPRRAMPSLVSVPPQHPSTPPTEKLLWYVDLGGVKTVEMTIEQLIVARRSGKLGEGALVWREGMQNWRPVGTLIPATSVAATRTPIPAAPSSPSRPPLPAPSRPPAPLPSRSSGLRPPPPGPKAELAPQSLASYERPVPTLEFALDQSETPKYNLATHSPLPSSPSRPPPPRSPSRPPPPRSLTPVPRPATWLASSAPNASSRPFAAPPVLAAPLPKPSPLPAPRATPIPTPLPSFTSDRPVETPVPNPAWDWLGDHPRWVSACIALLVCITASGSGAYLVRSLRAHRTPLVLSPTSASQPLPGSTAESHAAPLPPAPAPSAPRVVDLQSLSVERTVPRRVARPITPRVPKPAAEPESDVSEPEHSDPVEDEPSPAPQNKPQNADLPSAARSNPYLPSSDTGTANKTGNDE